MKNILAERPMSGFPLSIGTSLALETLFTPISPVYDEDRVVPDKPDLSRYNLLLINVSTLLRNLIGSIPATELNAVKYTDIHTTLLEEMQFLKEFTVSFSIPVSFYINSYKYVTDTYGKQNRLRKATTAKQIYIDTINTYCLTKLKFEKEILSFNNQVTINKECRCLMLTHIPWDLLGYSKFNLLELLESNTGVIKTRSTWNTKYFQVPGKDMSILPFMEYLLVTFGDSVMFHPDKLEKRLDVYDQLYRKKVHPLMSELALAFK